MKNFRLSDSHYIADLLLKSVAQDEQAGGNTWSGLTLLTVVNRTERWFALALFILSHHLFCLQPLLA